MWTLHLSPSRSTFHFALFTIHFPWGPLFTFHFALFTSRRDAFHLFHAVRCNGHRSVLRWSSQRAASGIAACCVFPGIFLCDRGDGFFRPFPESWGRRAGCFGMMANAEPRTVNFVNSTFFSPLAGMLERIFVNLQAGRTGGAIYVALREDDFGSLIYK